MLSYRSLCCLTYDPKGKYLPIDESERPMGKRYWYLDFADIGYNFRMTDAQAAVGLGAIARSSTGSTPAHARSPSSYASRLAGIRGLTLPYVSPEVEARLPRLSACWSSRSSG